MFVYFKTHFYFIGFWNIVSSWKRDSTINCTHSDFDLLDYDEDIQIKLFFTIQNIFCFEYFLLIEDMFVYYLIAAMQVMLKCYLVFFNSNSRVTLRLKKTEKWSFH